MSRKTRSYRSSRSHTCQEFVIGQIAVILVHILREGLVRELFQRLTHGQRPKALGEIQPARSSRAQAADHLTRWSRSHAGDGHQHRTSDGSLIRSYVAQFGGFPEQATTSCRVTVVDFRGVTGTRRSQIGPGVADGAPSTSIPSPHWTAVRRGCHRCALPCNWLMMIDSTPTLQCRCGDPMKMMIGKIARAGSSRR